MPFMLIDITNIMNHDRPKLLLRIFFFFFYTRSSLEEIGERERRNR